MHKPGPGLTVDIIIETRKGIVMIKRKNPPYGWALPGGFVDIGETIEQAAVREAKEETNLEVTIDGFLGIYSNPKRDPRNHNVSIVFLAIDDLTSEIKAADDAIEIREANGFEQLKYGDIVFDHAEIITDWLKTVNRLSFYPILK